MKRKGTYRPTIEDAIELSGIEILHPGGEALTRRTAEVAGLRPGLKVLDVSSGRGTLAIFYAKEFGVDVTGLDIAEEMVEAAQKLARGEGVTERVRFQLGDSQQLPFEDQSFDVVINECAVGIPDDSQRVLDEMVRVVKPGGRIVIHESTWRKPLEDAEKSELAERYGTTPLEHDEWVAMLRQAGAQQVETELEAWSAPENFWRIRQEREVKGPGDVLSIGERLTTTWRVGLRHGLRGVRRAFENERVFNRAILDGKIGYGLYWGERA